MPTPNLYFLQGSQMTSVSSHLLAEPKELLSISFFFPTPLHIWLQSRNVPWAVSANHGGLIRIASY